MDADDRAAFDRAWRIISQRAPEAMDYVVSPETVELIIDTIAVLAARTAALREAVEAGLDRDRGRNSEAARWAPVRRCGACIWAGALWRRLLARHSLSQISSAGDRARERP
jgi:hypothetical protein